MPGPGSAAEAAPWSELGILWEPEVLGTVRLAAVLVSGAGHDLIWVQQ